MNCCRETAKMGVHRATAGCWFRGVPERYVAGADTRGRQEGRPYPWLQQVIHETSGLASGLHWVLEFPADREPQEVLYGRERANIE